MAFFKRVFLALVFILGLSIVTELSVFHARELLNEKTSISLTPALSQWQDGETLSKIGIPATGNESRIV